MPLGDSAYGAVVSADPTFVHDDGPVCRCSRTLAIPDPFVVSAAVTLMTVDPFTRVGWDVKSMSPGSGAVLSITTETVSELWFPRASVAVARIVYVPSTNAVVSSDVG